MYRYILILCFSSFICLYAQPLADAKCVFRGDINFLEKNFRLEMNFQEKESVLLNLNVLPSDKFNLTAKLNHFKLLQSRFSSDLTSQGSIIRNEDGQWVSLKGLIQTNYSLLNLKPFRELKGYFEFDRSRLNLYSLMWGNLRISGRVKLGTPYSADLSLDIIDMDINELITLLGIDLEGLSVSGIVNGRVDIKGDIPGPRITGELQLSNGHIDDLKYSDIFVNIDGIYPVVKFVDSHVFEKDKYAYSLVGHFNLRELDNLDSPSHKFDMTPMVDDDFGWQAWKVRRKKMYGQDDFVEFEYRLKENRPFKMRLREDEEIFSLEHSLKF